MEDKTNPWVRANLETHSEDTLSLIPEARRAEYGMVMARMAFASDTLSNALTAVQTAHKNIDYAHQVRDAFFESLQNGTIPPES